MFVTTTKHHLIMRKKKKNVKLNPIKFMAINDDYGCAGVCVCVCDNHEWPKFSCCFSFHFGYKVDLIWFFFVSCTFVWNMIKKKIKMKIHTHRWSTIWMRIVLKKFKYLEANDKIQIQNIDWLMTINGKMCDVCMCVCM